jgi:hypothetical protein
MNKFKIRRIRLYETKLQKLVRLTKGTFYLLVSLVILELLKLVIFGLPVITVTRTEIKEKEVYTIPNTPEEYIKMVFGKDADKAFLLLKGRSDGSCAENRALDPSAFNRNWTNKPGIYWSTDWGIFQLNDKFHPVDKLGLKDWKANIWYAKRMFDNDGGTFSKRWVCGEYYKSLGYDI